MRFADIGKSFKDITLNTTNHSGKESVKMMQNSGNKKNGNQSNDYTALIWSIAIGVICFATHIFICKSTGISPALSGLILLAAYLAAVIFISVSIYHYQKIKTGAEEKISSNSNALRDLLAQIKTALVLTDGKGKILWHNDRLGEEFGIVPTIGSSMYDFCNLKEEKLLEESANGGTEFVYSDKHFNITCVKVRTQIKNELYDFYLSVFDNITEIYKATDLMERTLPCVAYITVDNLDELAKYVKVSHRQATNDIEKILKNWASGLGAILREYDRDSYVMIFTKEKLKKCTDEAFSILDDIREVRLGDDDNSMPVTVSMGISSAFPDPETNCYDLTTVERDALAALDLALQRGGDQVVIKNEKGIEYFGGRTKTIQTRTCVKARVISSKLCSLICASSKVLIMGHKNPDFDSIGACVGVARLSMFCGVECKIVVNKSNENFRISTERLASIAEYEHMFVDGAEAIDLLTPSTLLVIVDANNFKIIEAPEIAAHAKTIFVIDHHIQNDEMPENVIDSPYIDPAASSACELIAEILEQGVPTGTLQHEEANVMLSGIMVDTKNFTRSTSTRTFGAALYLRGEGANPEIARMFFNEEFDSYLSEAKFGSDVITYKQRIAITKSDGTGSPSDRVAAAKAADKLLTVRGIDAAFALVDVGGSVNISARSNGKINVQLILESLGGGGHFDAAGAQIGSVGMKDATNMLKLAIDSYLENINK